jgi:nucleotide-binding universal stress UspA family protein
MTPNSPSRCIVVGYDGSPASRAALDQAAQRAGADGRLYVVHACKVPGEWIGRPNYQRMLDIELERAESTMDELKRQVGERVAGVEWEAEVIGDDPAQAIAGVATAREADEIVVGTRGFGRARALLGSVAHELIHLAECPVTVIPERAVARRESDRDVRVAGSST